MCYHTAGTLTSPRYRRGNRHRGKNTLISTARKQKRLHANPGLSTLLHSAFPNVQGAGRGEDSRDSAVIRVIATVTAMTAITLRPIQRCWAASFGLTFGAQTRATFMALIVNSFQMLRRASTGEKTKIGEAEMVKKSESRAACEISSQTALANFINFSLSQLLPNISANRYVP